MPAAEKHLLYVSDGVDLNELPGASPWPRWRGGLTSRELRSWPDPRTPQALQSDRALKPAYLADADANRALLDRRVICELLASTKGVYEGVRRLSAKWCAEPSVHGGKARPKGAKMVI